MWNLVTSCENQQYLVYLDLDTCRGVMFSQLSNKRFGKFILLSYHSSVFNKGQRSFHFFSLNRSSTNAQVFAQFYHKKSFVKNVHVYTKIPCTVTFFKYKIITKLSIESQFCYVTFVDSQWIKLKSIFSSCFTKETKRAMLINNH